MNERIKYIAKQLGIDPLLITGIEKKEGHENFCFNNKTSRGYNFYKVKTSFGIDYICDVQKKKDDLFDIKENL